MTKEQEMIRTIQVESPGQISPAKIKDTNDPNQNEVEVRLELAGICGSDMPGFKTGMNAVGQKVPGFPAHECIGTVLRSPGDASLIGKKVIAIPNEDAGLRERFVAQRLKTHVLTEDLNIQTAILAQPLATVLAAVDRLDDVKGKSALIIGLGPIGLKFGFVLKRLGVSKLVGVDKRDRSTAPFAEIFDEITNVVVRDKFDIVIEAVGHNADVVNEAIEAAAPKGTVLFFGVPDDDFYDFKFKRFFRKNLNLVANVQPDWHIYLPKAEKFIAANPTISSLVTDIIDIDSVQTAFETAFQSIEKGRGKVLISVDAWLNV